MILTIMVGFWWVLKIELQRAELVFALKQIFNFITFFFELCQRGVHFFTAKLVDVEILYDLVFAVAAGARE